MRVLVTGANGQLGMCLKDLAKESSELEFIFKTSTDLDITSEQQILKEFENNTVDYVVNCAAYTNVDIAEEDSLKAHAVNVTGVENLAIACKNNNTTLIHISTDFVFDGKKNEAYVETDKPNPIGVYGATKLEGEVKVASTLTNHFIIRTSWLYSEYGHNFFKTMLRLAKDRDTLSVVSDQIGCPTYAKDLAEVIIALIKSKSEAFGLYHYSNSGQCSWYDFAKEIFKQANINIKVKPIKTEDYPTKAERPKYSVLDTKKIEKALSLTPKKWYHFLKQYDFQTKKM